MPIISHIGRRQPRTRVMIWAIYAVLTLGAATMVYPFLLMLSGSTKSAVDTPDPQVIPRYLINDTALYRKHIEGLFNESGEAMQNAYALFNTSFANLNLPEKSSSLSTDWRNFLQEEEQPAQWFIIGYFQCPLSRGVVPYNLAKLRRELLREEGSIEGINLKYGTSFPNMFSFMLVPPNFLNRFMSPPNTAFLKRIERFFLEQPDQWRYYVSLANFYRSFLQIKYGRNISAYNAAKGTTFQSWADVPFDDSAENLGPNERIDFEEFVRKILNPIWIRLNPSAEEAYRDYLRRKYTNDIQLLNTRYGSTFSGFETISLPEEPPLGSVGSDWQAFIEGWQDSANGEILAASLDAIRLIGPDIAFRDYLRTKYSSLENLNTTLGTQYSSWGVVPMPQYEAQYQDFLQMRGWLRWQFTIRNYVDVWNYLAVNGRGLLNTVIYCSLAILAALTVDPIAAYALSRFRPRANYQILLFLMLTMAFPAMVTQIPTFLLLRDLGFLNSFWALVLPGVANGYNIFLLKGFFDSLPKELYESADIDGASELTIFFNITMALSKPILAVIALGAFTSAYAAFMFALLLCQNPKMWTLMVWLYQLQQKSGQGIIFASLIVAAIPTFVVFLTCQNIIMRGIVVPVEK